MNPSIANNNSQENQEPAAINGFPDKQKEYREIISTLPRVKGWRTSEYLYQYQDFWWQQPLLEGAMYAQQNFTPRPTDIIVCSYPKTGTTWLKALTYAIVNRASFTDNLYNPLLKKNPHEFVPYIEIDLPNWPQVVDPKNPLFSTHIPFTSLPKSILDSSCKMVYIWRDPRDTFISCWTFLQKERSADGELEGLESAFDMFCRGISVYGPYLDHVLDYWKASQEFPERFLFLKYEDMRKECLPYVKKLAEFMGYPFEAAEEEEGVVEKVVELCSFEKLRSAEPNTGDREREDRPGVYSNSAYFRKGKVGDWRNYLTTEMGERLGRIMEEKFAGTGLISDGKIAETETAA